MTNLDNLETLSFAPQTNDIPEHFHETFCITLVKSGIETLNVNNQTIYSPAGHITITNPYEVHASPLVDKSQEISFDTIYLSQDLVDHFVNHKHVKFSQRQFNDQELIQSFIKLQKGITCNSAETESCLSLFLSQFKNQLHDTKVLSGSFNSANWPEVIEFIDHHLTNKISLDILAKFVGMDKFNLAKRFKMEFGISPIQYILMKKVFAAKKLIHKQSKIASLAYQFDFSDPAHFSKTFRRFVGFSPESYKKHLS